MRLDLHNHTKHSPDSRLEPRALVAAAKARGLDGLAITDHNAVGGVAEAQAAAGPEFLVIPGIEVSSRDGHVLAYGVRDLVPRDLTVEETVEKILALGGVAVAAHPYRFWSGLGEAAVGRAAFAAYETANARTLRPGNGRALARARADHVGQTGGSDAHFLGEVAAAATVVPGGLSTVDDVLQALGQRRTTAEGKDRGAAATARYVAKCVSEWMMRGFHRM